MAGTKIAKEKKFNAELVQDVIKSLIAWVVVSALGFLYWLSMLLVASIFLLNIWNVSFEQILKYSIVLAVITSIGYAGILIYRKFSN